MDGIINGWLRDALGEAFAERWGMAASILSIFLIAWLPYQLCIRILIPLANLITKNTRSNWDDDLLNPEVLRAVAQLVPAILVGMLLPESMHMGKKVYVWTVKLTNLYILWAGFHLVAVFLRGLQNALDKRMLLREQNLEILRQTIVLFIGIISTIIALGILINRDPLAILAGLGGLAAVLMLVFRDTILGFVAGIQLTVNKMLVRGDWIVAPKAGANGEVIEVRLTTIKVRNWDNSIVTVPPYTLFTDSFQNFANMKESGARRVSRSVVVDQSSIRLLSHGELAALAADGYATPAEAQGNPEGMVNLTLLRKYMERYLAAKPEVLHEGNGRPELTLMARELQPTPQGVPFELYFFTSITAWKPYENLQADVFDHLYTVLPRFGLSAYQAPAAQDFRQSRENRSLV